MNSNQNVKKPAEASKNTQQHDQQKDKTGKHESGTGAKNAQDDREDAQGDDNIGTQSHQGKQGNMNVGNEAGNQKGHANKAMGNAAGAGQQQKDNAGTGHHDGQHDKNKSKDGSGGQEKHQDSSKHQGSSGGQHKN